MTFCCCKALNTTAPLIPYTTLLNMLVLAWVLGRQILLNMRRIERFNHELSITVTQACDDLSQTWSANTCWRSAIPACKKG